MEAFKVNGRESHLPGQVQVICFISQFPGWREPLTSFIISGGLEEERKKDRGWRERAKKRGPGWEREGQCGRTCLLPGPAPPMTGAQPLLVQGPCSAPKPAVLLSFWGCCLQPSAASSPARRGHRTPAGVCRAPQGDKLCVGPRGRDHQDQVPALGTLPV